jgi:hypothetical protein
MRREVRSVFNKPPNAVEVMGALVLRPRGLAFTSEGIAFVPSHFYFGCMTRTRPLYFVVNAVLFAAFTVAAWLAPTVLAGPLEISLTTPTALADFRAVYGGLSFAIAGLSLLALRKVEFRLAQDVLLWRPAGPRVFRLEGRFDRARALALEASFAAAP